MKYFKLNPSVSSKKWKGYINPSDELIIDGTDIDAIDLLSSKDVLLSNKLFFNVIRDGDFSPVNTIGSDFILFDSTINKINNISGNGVKLVPVSNNENPTQVYLIMYLFDNINCVNWELSEVDLWPSDYTPKDWESKRGRFFIRPVLYKNKIPESLDAFRLNEWEGAFNIVISERLRDKILALDFDHSFLEFWELTIV